MKRKLNELVKRYVLDPRELLNEGAWDGLVLLIGLLGAGATLENYGHQMDPRGLFYCFLALIVGVGFRIKLRR